MTTKFIEIRDRATTIPALAFDISKQDDPLAWRAGFGDHPCIYLLMLSSEKAAYDPYSSVWGGARTMPIAHQWLAEHWAEVKSGDVVDVQFILGETSAPKASEVSR